MHESLVVGSTLALFFIGEIQSISVTKSRNGIKKDSEEHQKMSRSQTVVELFMILKLKRNGEHKSTIIVCWNAKLKGSSVKIKLPNI